MHLGRIVRQVDRGCFVAALLAMTCGRYSPNIALATMLCWISLLPP